MSAIDLTDLKAHLNISHARDDAELQRVLDAAEAWVNRGTGRLLGGGTRTLSARALSGRVLILPAVGLSSVAGLTDPSGLAASPRPEDVDLFAGIIGLPYCRRGVWTVEGTWGADPIEPDIQLAVLIIARHLWETQRTAGQPEGGRPGFGSYAEAAVPMQGFAIPNRARDLLAPHWLVVSA